MAKALSKADQKKQLASVDAELNSEMADIAKSISAPSGNKIKTRDKSFGFPDGSVESGPVDFIILDYVSQKRFYEGAWDPNTPTPIGLTYIAIGDYDKAFKAFEWKDTNLLFLGFQGTLLYRRGKFKQSAKYCQSIIPEK